MKISHRKELDFQFMAFLGEFKNANVAWAKTESDIAALVGEL